MAIITISRQVAALGDEIAEATAKKLHYSFINRKEIERRIIALGFDKETLKNILQHKCRHGNKRNPCIQNTVIQKFAFGTEHSGNFRDHQCAENGKQNATDGGHIDQHGEVFIGLFLFPFSEGFGNDRAAAGSNHKA